MIYRISIQSRKLKNDYISPVIKIEIDDVSSFISIKEKIISKSFKNGSVCTGDSMALLLNKKINGYVERARKFIEECIDNKIEICSADVIRHLKNGKAKRSQPKYLIQELKEKIRRMNLTPDISCNTVSSYESTLLTYKEYASYCSVKEFCITDLNHDFFEDFLIWSFNIKKYNHSTIHKKLTHINFFMEEGVMNRHISHDPSKKVKKDLEKKVRKKSEQKISSKNLTIDIVEKIKSIEDSVTKDVFLFQCYTGLSFVDIKTLKYSSIQSGSNTFYIEGHRKKTESKFTIMLCKEAMDILAKYKGDHERIVYDLAMPVPSYTNYSIKLKDIANKIGIENLTSHMARYSYINISRDKGFSDEYIANNVGQNSTNMIRKVYSGELSLKRQQMEYLKIA